VFALALLAVVLGAALSGLLEASLALELVGPFAPVGLLLQPSKANDRYADKITANQRTRMRNPPKVSFDNRV
jgi:hypothetical protein